MQWAGGLYYAKVWATLTAFCTEADRVHPQSQGHPPDGVRAECADAGFQVRRVELLVHVGQEELQILAQLFQCSALNTSSSARCHARPWPTEQRTVCSGRFTADGGHNSQKKCTSTFFFAIFLGQHVAGRIDAFMAFDAVFVSLGGTAVRPK